MPNDVNIKVNTTAPEAARQMDQFERSVRQVGPSAEKANNQIGDSSERATQKLGLMGRMAENVKGQIGGMILGLLGVQTVIKIIDAVVDRMRQMRDTIIEIYQQSLPLLELGQSLEYQTGTKGRARDWGRQIADVWEAGGLRDAETAKNLITSADIAFSGIGGVQNQEVMDLLKGTAPFLGMANFGSEEVGKIFALGDAAKIPGDIESYKTYLAQLHAAYTKSQSQDASAFMEGLQGGATPYMAAGGSLEEAMGLYAGVLQVLGVGKEAEASTIVKNIGLLSSGTNPTALQAMERSQGVRWADLSGDERLAAMMGHAAAIPENVRQATLAQQGFPQEAIAAISGLVQPGAMGTIHTTRQAVGSATALTDQAMADAWMASDLGMHRQSEARNARRILDQPTSRSLWARHYTEAQQRFKTEIEQRGEESIWRTDEAERVDFAIQSIIAELEALGPLSPSDEELRNRTLRKLRHEQPAGVAWGGQRSTAMNAEGVLAQLLESRRIAIREAEPSASEGQGASQGGATVINNYSNHNNTNYFPQVNNNTGSLQPGSAVIDANQF